MAKIDDKVNKNIITALDKLFIINKMSYLEIGKKDNLSPIQIQFLEYIDKNPMTCCTITNLSKEYDLKKPTVSDSVANLLEKGYLNKIQDSDDARMYFFSLTNKSKEKLAAFENRNNTILKVLLQFPVNEKEIIVKFLLTVIGDYFFQGSIHSAKICLTCNNFVRNSGNSDHPFYCNFSKEFMDYIDLKAYCHFHENKHD